MYLSLPALGLSCGMRYLSLWCAGCLLRRAGFSLAVACRFFLFSSCGSQAPGHVGSVVCGTQALSLRRMGLVAPRHVGSSWTRARTYVPCIGRRILNHCATREVPRITCNLKKLPKKSKEARANYAPTISLPRCMKVRFRPNSTTDETFTHSQSRQ